MDRGIYSQRVFIMDTSPPQGVGAVSSPGRWSLISEGMAPIPHGKSHPYRDGSRDQAFHARLFVGVFQKSSLNRVCQLLAIHAHEMAPRTSKRLQERAWDTHTKGLLWRIDEGLSLMHKVPLHPLQSDFAHNGGGAAPYRGTSLTRKRYPTA